MYNPFFLLTIKTPRRLFISGETFIIRMKGLCSGIRYAYGYVYVSVYVYAYVYVYVYTLEMLE